MTVTLAINSFHCEYSDRFWLFFTDKEVWYPLYAIIAGLLIWRLGWKRGLTMIIAAILCIVATDQLCNLVKGAVARLRPCNDAGMVARGLHMLIPPSVKSPYGFFSAHAGNAMAFAVCTTMAFSLDKKRKAYLKGYGITLVVWAILVGMSRVFVARHFLGDVITGWVAGAIIGLLIGSIAKRL